MKTTRLPSLDGWRALSILLVVGSHLHFSRTFPAAYAPMMGWFFDGNLGVRCFFVISGFIITWLLLQEHERSGPVNLKNFYVRRAFRILPVYYAFLMIVLLFQVFTAWKQPLILWLANIFFLSDFIGAPQITSHLWSLAVEEKFYLIWPLALAMAGANKKRLTGLLTVPLLAGPICRMVTEAQWAPAALSPLFNYFSFFNYCDSLAMGCLAAILFHQGWKPQHTALAGAMAIFPQILVCGGIWPSVLYVVGPTCQAAGFAMLLVQSIMAPSKFKALNSKVMVHIGVLSYSIYIWQQLFWSKELNFFPPRYWYVGLPLSLAMIYLASLASYNCLEKPFQKLRARFASSQSRAPQGKIFQGSGLVR